MPTPRGHSYLFIFAQIYNIKRIFTINLFTTALRIKLLAFEGYTVKVFLILFSIFIYSEEHPCGASRSDFRMDSEGNTAEHLPDKLQLFNICYAHTASDMVDSYLNLLSQGTSKWQTSPMATAILTSLNRKAKVKVGEFEWGNICQAVNTLTKNGSYSRQQIDAKLFKNMFYNEELKENPSLKQLSNIGRKYFKRLYTHYDTGARSIKKGEDIEQNTKELQCLLKETDSEEAQNLVSNSWDALINAIRERNYLNYLLNIVQLFGQDKKRVPPLQCSVFKHNKKSPKKTIEHIHKNLDKGKSALPIGLDFCEEILEKGKISAFKKCDRHAATIIGRREKEGSCELLIKNTFPCNHFHKKYECEKEGKVWIKQESLVKAIMSIHTIKPKSRSSIKGTKAP